MNPFPPKFDLKFDQHESKGQILADVKQNEEYLEQNSYLPTEKNKILSTKCLW